MKGQIGRLRPPPSMSLDRPRHGRHRRLRAAGSGPARGLLLGRRFACRRSVRFLCCSPFLRSALFRALLRGRLARRLLGAVFLRRALLRGFTLGGSLHHDRVPSANLSAWVSVPTKGVNSVARLISRARGSGTQNRQLRIDSAFRHMHRSVVPTHRPRACAIVFAIRSSRLRSNVQRFAEMFKEARESPRRDHASAARDHRSLRKVIVFLESINIHREAAAIANDFLLTPSVVRNFSTRSICMPRRTSSRVVSSQIDRRVAVARSAHVRGSSWPEKKFCGTRKKVAERSLRGVQRSLETRIARIAR
jgi:hypothetical protein